MCPSVGEAQRQEAEGGAGGRGRRNKSHNRVDEALGFHESKHEGTDALDVRDGRQDVEDVKVLHLAADAVVFRTPGVFLKSRSLH